MLDADDEKARAFLFHVARNGNKVPGSHVATAQAGRAAVDCRNVVNGREAGAAGISIRECSLDVVCQRVVRGNRIVHSFQYGERPQVAQRLHYLPAGERPVAGDMHDAQLDPLFAANVVDRRHRRFEHAAHAHDGVFRVFHAVAVQHLVAAASQPIELVHRILHRAAHLRIVLPLRNFALHIAVLILHNTGHDRIIRVE